MILKSVEFFEFKSIKNERIEINNNQLCLVGINESGKTSIIKAISYLDVHKELHSSLLNKESDNYPHGFPLISGVFEITKKHNIDLFKLIYDYTIITVDVIIGETFYIQLKRWGNGFNNISLEMLDSNNFKTDLISTLQDPNKRTQFLDAFFDNHFPIIEFFEGEELLLEPASPKDLQGNDIKYETFRRLLFVGGCTDFTKLDTGNHHFFATYIKRIENKINGILKKHYKQDNSISINIMPVGDNKLVLIINDSTEQSFSLDERSPGFQYYFAFLINKIYYNQFYKSKNVIFLLDEPGTSLHPKGSKDLLKTFSEISTNSLLLYTTHNPFLVLRDNMDGLILVQKNHPHGTKVNRKSWQNKYQTLRKELGILLNDSFLVGDFNLLVEGATEKFALPIFFKMKEYDHLEWVNIYNVDGVSKISPTLNFLGPLNLNQSGLVLLDSDNDGKEEMKKAGFKKVITEKNWDVVEINNVFDNDTAIRTFEDLFPQDLYIRAFNEYCNVIKNIGVFDSEYVDYVKTEESIPTPIINTLEHHFYSFVKEERKRKQSITKHDVIRHLLEIIFKDSEEIKAKSLKKVFELIKLINEKIIKIESHVNNQA